LPTRQYEREKPAEIEVLEESVERWRAWRRAGKTMWGSDKWMKEPKYYQGLKTPELAKECFGDTIFGNTVRAYLQPRFGIVCLKEMHNGFAELFQREEMGAGVLAAYEDLGAQLQPDADLNTIVRVSMTLDAMQVLYQERSLRNRLGGARTFS
jgi:hypothetical protein